MSAWVFEDQQCITCFIAFRVPEGFTAARRHDGRNFYCPNCGNQMHYKPGETEADKLRRERDLLKQQMARKDDDIASLNRLWAAANERAATAERKIKRVEKRAHAGLCPCCNRTFSELAKHIKSKHPGFRAKDVARENVVSLVKAKPGHSSPHTGRTP